MQLSPSSLPARAWTSVRFTRLPASHVHRSRGRRRRCLRREVRTEGHTLAEGNDAEVVREKGVGRVELSAQLVCRNTRVRSRACDGEQRNGLSERRDAVLVLLNLRILQAQNAAHAVR